MRPEFLGGQTIVPDFMALLGHDVTCASCIGPASASSFAPLHSRKKKKNWNVVWAGLARWWMSHISLLFHCTRFFFFFFQPGEEKKNKIKREPLSIMQTTRHVGCFLWSGYVRAVSRVSPRLFTTTSSRGQWTCRDKETLFVCFSSCARDLGSAGVVAEN